MAQQNVDSLDLLFASSTQVAAIAFNPVSMLGPTDLAVSVFDTDNVLVGRTTVSADVAGSNTVGIQVPPGTFIGRVNLYSPTNEWEGGDDIALYAVPEPTPDTNGPEITGISFAGSPLQANGIHIFADTKIIPKIRNNLISRR